MKHFAIEEMRMAEKLSTLRWRYAVVDMGDGGFQVAIFDTLERAHEEVEYLDDKAGEYRFAVRPVLVRDEPKRLTPLRVAAVAAALFVVWFVLGA